MAPGLTAPNIMAAVMSNPQPTAEQISALVFNELMTKLLYPAEDAKGGTTSTSQLVALTWIHDNRDCTVKQLAAGIRVNHSAASQLAHKLAADGLISIEPGPKDRRQVRLRVRAAGDRALADARGRRLEALDGILSRMSESERKALSDGLAGFLKVALASERNVDDACGRCWVEHFGDCIVNIAHRQITGRESKRVSAATT